MNPAGGPLVPYTDPEFEVEDLGSSSSEASPDASSHASSSSDSDGAAVVPRGAHESDHEADTELDNPLLAPDAGAEMLAMIDADSLGFIRQYCDSLEEAGYAVDAILAHAEDGNTVMMNVLRGIAAPDPELEEGETRLEMASAMLRGTSSTERRALAEYCIANAENEHELADMMVFLSNRSTPLGRKHARLHLAREAVPHLLRPAPAEDPRSRLVRAVLGLLEDRQGSELDCGFGLCDALVREIVRVRQGDWWDVLGYTWDQLPDDNAFRNAHVPFNVAALTARCRAVATPNAVLEELARYCVADRFIDAGLRAEVAVLNQLSPDISKYLLFALPEERYHAIYTPPDHDNELQDHYYQYSKRRAQTLQGWDNASAEELTHLTTLMAMYPDRLTTLMITPWLCFLEAVGEYVCGNFMIWLEMQKVTAAGADEYDEEELQNTPGIMIASAMLKGDEAALNVLALYPHLSDTQKQWVARGCSAKTLANPLVQSVLTQWPPARSAALLSLVPFASYESLLDQKCAELDEKIAACRDAAVALEAGGDGAPSAQELGRLHAVLATVGRGIHVSLANPDARAAEVAEGGVQDRVAQLQALIQEAAALKPIITDALLAGDETSEEEGLPMWFWDVVSDATRKHLGLPTWHILEQIGIKDEGDLHALGITEEHVVNCRLLRRDVENVVDVIRRYSNPDLYPPAGTPFTEPPTADTYWQGFFNIAEAEAVERGGLHPSQDPSVHFSTLFDPGTEPDTRAVRELVRFLVAQLAYVQMPNSAFCAEMNGALESVEERLQTLGGLREGRDAKRVKPSGGMDRENLEASCATLIWEGVKAYKQHDATAKLQRYLSIEAESPAVQVHLGISREGFLDWIGEHLADSGIGFDDAARDALVAEFMPDPTRPVPPRLVTLVALLGRWRILRGAPGNASVSKLSVLRDHRSWDMHGIVRGLWPDDTPDSNVGSSNKGDGSRKRKYRN